MELGVTAMLCGLALTLAFNRFGVPLPSRERELSVEPHQAFRLDPTTFYQLRSGGHRVGPENAAVSIVVFETYSCGKCAQFWTALDSIRDRYPDHVNVIFRSYIPDLDRSNGAVMTHLAAECAADQGRFREYSHAVFADPSATGFSERWLALGQTSGVQDLNEFEECTRSHRFLQHLEDDTRLGAKLKIPGTPTNFINGFAFAGIVRFEVLDSIVGTILRSPIEY